jgi:hypothetical protein
MSIAYACRLGYTPVRGRQAKTTHMMVTSTIPSSISVEDAVGLLAREMPSDRGELFLKELANLKQTDAAAISRFLKEYPEFVIPPQMESGKLRLASESPAVERGRSEVDNSLPRAMFSILVLLRSAWKRATPFEREVSLALTQRYVCNGLLQKETGSRMWRVFGNIFIALMGATKQADRLRYCENPTCPAPHFIAKRRTEKYCSEVCANVGQQEQKRRWWQENGPEWRKRWRKRKRKHMSKSPKKSKGRHRDGTQ